MRSGSLFTGTGALDMAAADVFGAEPAWFADLDPAASALLAHHHPDVPNLRDITTVDWELVALLSPVDLLTAGWPCQPFSLAGQKQGAVDERALWPEVDRCVRALRPRVVCLENVPAVAGAGELERVANTLASCGYRIAWVCLSASAVGAAHKRDRLFVLAVSDSARVGRGERRPEPAGFVGGPDVAGGAGSVGDLWQGYTESVHRWERITGRAAPAPTVPGGRTGHLENPEFPEWLMGLPAGWITAVPGMSRAQKVKLAGNGVVPRQAAAAYRYLLDVLEQDARAAA